jgi:hypothetical protein
VALLIVALRCGPGLSAAVLAKLPQGTVDVAGRIAVFLALAHSLAGLTSLRGAGLASTLVFVAAGLVIYALRRNLSLAILGAALAYALAQRFLS